jgi:cation:H+ antiporter
MLPLHAYPIWLNLLVFLVGAAVIWIAGTRLAVYADAIADSTGLGQAFVGLVLLGFAASLPEMATTATASALGNARMAANNLLGGVVTQTAVLAVVDLVLVRGALTFVAPHPSLLVQGVLLVGLLGLGLAGIALGEPLVLGWVGLATVLLFLGYLCALYVSYRYEGQPAWRPIDLPDAVWAEETQASVERPAAQSAGVPLAHLAIHFGIGSLVVLAAGWTVAQTADVLAEQSGLGGSFIGGTLLAAATALPELSTTVGAVRLGAYSMAIANAFGSNALLLALFFPCDLLYRDGPILQAVDSSTLFAGGLGIMVTCVYLWGLLERNDRSIFRMGIDSMAVLVLYGVGILGFLLLR